MQSDIKNRFGDEDETQDAVTEQLKTTTTTAPVIFVTNRPSTPNYRPISIPTYPPTIAPSTKYYYTQRPYQAPQSPQLSQSPLAPPARILTTRLQPVTYKLPQQIHTAPATSTIRQVIVRQPLPNNPSYQVTNPSSFVTRRPFSTVNVSKSLNKFYAQSKYALNIFCSNNTPITIIIFLICNYLISTFN